MFKTIQIVLVLSSDGKASIDHREYHPRVVLGAVRPLLHPPCVRPRNDAVPLSPAHNPFPHLTVPFTSRLSPAVRRASSARYRETLPFLYCTTPHADRRPPSSPRLAAVASTPSRPLERTRWSHHLHTPSSSLRISLPLLTSHDPSDAPFESSCMDPEVT